MRRDPFDVLCLPRGASEEEIRSAYRRLALERHPDRGGSVEAMIELTEARDSLLRGVVAGSPDLGDSDLASVLLSVGFTLFGAFVRPLLPMSFHEARGRAASLGDYCALTWARVELSHRYEFNTWSEWINIAVSFS